MAPITALAAVEKMMPSSLTLQMHYWSQGVQVLDPVVHHPVVMLVGLSSHLHSQELVQVLMLAGQSHDRKSILKLKAQHQQLLSLLVAQSSFIAPMATLWRTAVILATVDAF